MTNGLTEEIERLRAINEDLLEACKLLFSYIEDGTLIRDTSKDESGNWSLWMMRFVRDLGEIRAAIAKGEAK